ALGTVAALPARGRNAKAAAMASTERREARGMLFSSVFGRWIPSPAANVCAQLPWQTGAHACVVPSGSVAQAPLIVWPLNVTEQAAPAACPLHASIVSCGGEGGGGRQTSGPPFGSW